MFFCDKNNKKSNDQNTPSLTAEMEINSRKRKGKEREEKQYAYMDEKRVGGLDPIPQIHNIPATLSIYQRHILKEGNEFLPLRNSMSCMFPTKIASRSRAQGSADKLDV